MHIDRMMASAPNVDHRSVLHPSRFRMQQDARDARSIYVKLSVPGHAKLHRRIVHPLLADLHTIPSSRRYFRNRRLRRATLSSSQTVQGISLPAGTHVEFDKGGKLKHIVLPSDTMIKGVPCAKGSQPINVGYARSLGTLKGLKVTFYPNGNIAQAYLSRNRRIQGIDCAKVAIVRQAGTLIKTHNTSFYAVPITFHSNGKLKSTKLSRKQRIQGVLCSKLRNVTFDSTGKLASTFLEGDQVIKGIPCDSSRVVEFHPNGRPKSCTLSRNAMFQGFFCRKGTRVEFHPDGKIKMTYIGTSLVIKDLYLLPPRVRPLRVPPGTKVELDRYGTIVRVTFMTNVPFRTSYSRGTYSKGSSIRYHRRPRP